MIDVWYQRKKVKLKFLACMDDATGQGVQAVFAADHPDNLLGKGQGKVKVKLCKTLRIGVAFFCRSTPRILCLYVF